MRANLKRREIETLLSCVAAFVTQAGDQYSHKVARLLSDPPRSYRSIRAKAVPVNAYLPRALRVTHGSTAAIAASAAALSPALSWSSTEFFENELEVSQQIRRNIGIASLAGPQGPAYLSELSIGLLLLGPNTKFPEWTLDSFEFQLLCSGAAGVKIADGAWTPLPPGALCRIPAGAARRIQTGSEPLLSVYIRYLAS